MITSDRHATQSSSSYKELGRPNSCSSGHPLALAKIMIIMPVIYFFLSYTSSKLHPLTPNPRAHPSVNFQQNALPQPMDHASAGERERESLIELATLSTSE